MPRSAKRERRGYEIPIICYCVDRHYLFSQRFNTRENTHRARNKNDLYRHSAAAQNADCVHAATKFEEMLPDCTIYHQQIRKKPTFLVGLFNYSSTRIAFTSCIFTTASTLPASLLTGVGTKTPCNKTRCPTSKPHGLS